MNEIDKRRETSIVGLQQALTDAQDTIEKNYLEQLSSLEVVSPNSTITDIDFRKCGCFFHLKRLVTNKDENFLDKMVTVANAVSPLGCTLTTIVKSDGNEINYYVGVIAKNARTDSSADKALHKATNDTFSGAINGNFCGSKLVPINDEEDLSSLHNILSSDAQSVAAISGIISLRNKENADTESFVQGLENLTNSLSGKKYTIIMIADPVNGREIRNAKQGFETIYSQLVSFQGHSLTFNESKSLTLSEGQTTGITKGLNIGTTRSQFSSANRSRTRTNGWDVNAGGIIKGIVSLGASYNRSKANSEGTAQGTSVADAFMENWTNSTTKSEGKAEGRESGSSLTMDFENRSVKSILDTINKHIERLEFCENYGAFQCATYVLANNREDTLSVAGLYNSLMRGDESFVQTSSVSVWSPDSLKEVKKKDKNEYYDKAERIKEYLQSFSHPEFYLHKKGNNKSKEDIVVLPSALISGRELAMQFTLPKKSIRGLTVLEMTPFGRNPSQPEKKLDLGQLYYMGAIDTGKTKVVLDKQSLTMHTFITGSTGSGKSNTIYGMIDRLCIKDKDIKFLVIEPAKGEYKNVFGDLPDVSVYGTNPYKTELLRINPFKFPTEEIHVLEHLDRLVEIFNVCWPMYAAMPAILKDAMERAYVAAGWDIIASINPNGDVFPNFTDLLEQTKIVINESDYSTELRGNYTGALCTRIRSLTTGLNSMILGNDDLEDGDLFDKNVIIDLSRVGSAETKALIMGILVMKLNEYRISKGGMNKPLSHITVLEEAHNLLKRTSTDQSQESSNLIGKSVEQIANSIAEMRTYGEGFIIADQSPGMLDMSAIRNTNTKIILRLPERSDRELVGFAAGLNEEQVEELAKLETGVAAVYQNDWIEPVLVSMVKYKYSEQFEYKKESEFMKYEAKNRARIIKHLLSKITGIESGENVDDLCKIAINLNVNAEQRYKLSDRIKHGNNSTIDDVKNCVVKLLGDDVDAMRQKLKKAGWKKLEEIVRNIDVFKLLVDNDVEDTAIRCIAKYFLTKDESYKSWEKLYIKEVIG